jgi:nitrile hydratase
VAELGFPMHTTHLVALENTETVQQRGRLHPLLLLSAGAPRPAAELVQEPLVPRPHGARAARRPGRVRHGPSGSHRGKARVHDSTADMRYLVVPRRPEGTEALSEEELSRLVTRDAMIGVSEAKAPAHGR